MSDGITDSWRNWEDYWKNKFYSLVEENKRLERKIKRLTNKKKKKGK